MSGLVLTAALALALGTTACGGGNTPPQGGPTAPGADRTAKTAALETGANLMQTKAPVEKIAMYLDGFRREGRCQDADGGAPLLQSGV